MPPNSWACLYLLEGEEADCQRQEDVQFSGVVQQKHALGEEVGVFEPASSETLVAITTSSRRAESLTEATLKSLHDVVKAGKARISAPPLHAWQFACALGIAERHGWTRFVIMQNLVNPLYREEEREMLPLCAAEDRRHPHGVRRRAAG